MNDLFDKLNTLITKYDNIILMGHHHPDLDVLGSCLALYEIIKSKNKNPYIFLDRDNINKYNDSIKKSINKIEFNYINELNYKKVINNCLLIIVDLHQQERLEYPEILNENIDTVIIKNKQYFRIYRSKSFKCNRDSYTIYAIQKQNS